MHEIIDITPDISLLPKLSHAGYNAPQAVAELVDNSIDARIKDQLLTISITIDSSKIIVADNGKGMTKDEMKNAFILARSYKKNQLGEFGLGLKTAALSLGHNFEVRSSADGDNEEYRVKYESKIWNENCKEWKLPLFVELAEINDHFTIVVIDDLKIFYPNLHNYIRQDLQRRFEPYIRNGQIRILVNKEICEPEQFDLIEESFKEFNIKTKGGHLIAGWYSLLHEGSNKGYYGFSTFRRGRMITTYDKIAIGEHPTISRIIGEIHMDHIPVTHNKREWLKESYEYKEAEQLLMVQFVELLRQARKKARQDTLTPEVQRNIDIWKDKITQAIRSDEFKHYTVRFKNLSEIIKEETGDEEDEAPVEKRDGKNESSNTPTPKNNRQRKPNKTHSQKRHTIRIRGKNIHFDHHFSELGIKESWKRWVFDEKTGIEIYTNIDFPAYEVTKDKVFYAVLHIAESLAELMVEKACEDQANVDEIKELILRKAASLKIEIDDEKL